LIFDLAEMSGAIDPFEMMGRLPRSVFLYWKARHELYLTTLHKKEEYYLAAIRRDILATVAGDKAGNVDDYLIKFEFKSEEELEQQVLDKHNKYMEGLAGLSNKVNKG